MPGRKIRQEKIQVAGQEFIVTAIPTATSGCWYTIHDAFEVWAAVAIDPDRTVIGWQNEPTRYKAEIEAAIKKAFADDFFVG